MRRSGGDISAAVAFDRYVTDAGLRPGGAKEYQVTLAKLNRWARTYASTPMHRSSTPTHNAKNAQNNGPKMAALDRAALADFLAWVYRTARAEGATNPGRVSNKCRGHLHAVLAWLVERGELPALPVFPRLRPQRSAAGLFVLRPAELDALYLAADRLTTPASWEHEAPLGAYWRAALVWLLTYGTDTQTLFPYNHAARPLRWADLEWGQECPARDYAGPTTNAWGWVCWVRAKTGRPFVRPLTEAARLHFELIRPSEPDPVGLVFGRAGGPRPCQRFAQLVKLAGLGPKRDRGTGEEGAWLLRDLRKTCATLHETNLPGAAQAVLGHAGNGVTLRHYANHEPLAHRATLALAYPPAIAAATAALAAERDHQRKHTERAPAQAGPQTQDAPGATAGPRPGGVHG